jgi:glycine/D-amino acid oxidase-like deaminating enzyme
VAKAYEHQCRKMGVRFATGTAVDGIDVREGRVRGVRTDRGTVECRYVINAAGAHAYHVAKLVGLELPIVPVRHEYYVTVDLPGLTPDLPCFRVPERTLYGRVADGGGLLLGGWERRALETDPRGYEIDQPAPTLKPDGEVLDDFEAKFAPLFPQGVGRPRRRVGIGWPTFTPDGHFIIGESGRVPGFVMAGGCNAHGISGSAGIGRLLVQSLEKDPPAYVRGLSPDRFTETGWDWADARRQARQVYETYYGTEG